MNKSSVPRAQFISWLRILQTNQLVFEDFFRRPIYPELFNFVVAILV